MNGSITLLEEAIQRNVRTIKSLCDDNKDLKTNIDTNLKTIEELERLNALHQQAIAVLERAIL